MRFKERLNLYVEIYNSTETVIGHLNRIEPGFIRGDNNSEDSYIDFDGFFVFFSQESENLFRLNFFLQFEFFS